MDHKSRDREVDPRVVGAGPAGMTAALVGNEKRLKAKKAALGRGAPTTAEGSLWILGNELSEDAGAADKLASGTQRGAVQTQQHHRRRNEHGKAFVVAALISTIAIGCDGLLIVRGARAFGLRRIGRRFGTWCSRGRTDLAPELVVDIGPVAGRHIRRRSARRRRRRCIRIRRIARGKAVKPRGDGGGPLVKARLRTHIRVISVGDGQGQSRLPRAPDSNNSATTAPLAERT